MATTASTSDHRARRVRHRRVRRRTSPSPYQGVLAFLATLVADLDGAKAHPVHERNGQSGAGKDDVDALDACAKTRGLDVADFLCPTLAGQQERPHPQQRNEQESRQQQQHVVDGLSLEGPTKTFASSSSTFVQAHSAPRKPARGRNTLLSRRDIGPRTRIGRQVTTGDDDDDSDDVAMYNVRDVPDRYELGIDGRWHKVTYYPTCSKCQGFPHDVVGPVNNEETTGNPTPIAADDLSVASDTAISPTGVSSSVKLPDGWGHSSTTDVYKAVIISVSSLIVAAIFFTLLVMVVLWRQKRRKAAKQADLEKRKKDRAIADGDSDEEDDGRASVNGKSKKKERKNWTRATARWRRRVRLRRPAGRRVVADSIVQREASTSLLSVNGDPAGQEDEQNDLPQPEAREHSSNSSTLATVENTSADNANHYGPSGSAATVASASTSSLSRNFSDSGRHRSSVTFSSLHPPAGGASGPHLGEYAAQLTTSVSGAEQQRASGQVSNGTAISHSQQHPLQRERAAYDIPPSPPLSIVEVRGDDGAASALPPAYRSRWRQRPAHLNRNMSSSSGVSSVSDAVAVGVSSTVTGTSRHAHCDDEKRPGHSRANFGGENESGESGCGGLGVETASTTDPARGTATTLHVATDDKQALARLADLASAPGLSDHSGEDDQEHGSQPPAISVTGASAPEWRDEEFEDFGTEAVTGALPSPFSTENCYSPQSELENLPFPAPPKPVPSPCPPSPSSSPRRTSLSLSPLDFSGINNSFAHLPLPSPSRPLTYSFEEEEIERMDGEFGPSAPPSFADVLFENGNLDGVGVEGSGMEIDDQLPQPSAPPLSEDDMEFEFEEECHSARPASPRASPLTVEGAEMESSAPNSPRPSLTIGRTDDDQ